MSSKRRSIVPSALATIRAAPLLRFKERLDLREPRVQSLFRRHGIAASQYSDPYAVVPLSAYVAFIEEAAMLSGDPLLGARVGQGYRPADIGPIGILFSISESLRVGFSRLARMLPAFQAHTSVALLEEEAGVAWVYKINEAQIWPRRQDAEYAISATCAMIRSSCGSSWCPIEVRFEHEPPSDPAVVRMLRGIFRAPVSFGHATNALVMDASHVDKIRHIEDRDLVTVLEHHLTDLLGKIPQDPSVKQAVLTVIDIYLGHRRLEAQVIASALGMPVRTLQRRLAEEGTSIRQLVQVHRLAAANQRLGTGGTPIANVAEALGYADSTSFSRAFRDWTGTPPSRWAER
ncbi:Helix-turn-helix, AraC domain protein [Sphingobium chlorophenolicum L-1]|uniref:Helix-turn-helix, AraC domain protein n=1 Tax=Sphingobium chlorophenolicum L-1 TaxID=690566 RepID=F6EWX3_SPHCR|nr:AraC family transcriptional regulator [Sphingobium chlorophenolicum]AEG48136.1 Helix-turn-helix, AraC domain protein [Sphingobium chlorophenolicum L-1]